ncbi:hypothetical protein ACHAO9_007777 [Fusarium lateritium]
MYCRVSVQSSSPGGSDPKIDDPNTNLVVNPLWDLPQKKWWMQADRGCHEVPPAEGDFLELPAGGEFTVELATNRAFTSLSHGGKYVSDWPDGLVHPEDWSSPDETSCLGDNKDGKGGALHTSNQTSAAGTAWAISYQSDIRNVTMDNLAVFTVLEHTPWKRLATYQVPKDMPECPDGGCYCAWLWVPDGCGQPNMFVSTIRPGSESFRLTVNYRYMQNFKCRVTGTSSTKRIGPAKIPVPCLNDESKCTKGPKQMIAWHQSGGNNVDSDIGFSPGYNIGMGYSPGAQTDLFVDEQYYQPASASVASGGYHTTSLSSTVTSEHMTLATVAGSTESGTERKASTSSCRRRHHHGHARK